MHKVHCLIVTIHHSAHTQGAVKHGDIATAQQILVVREHVKSHSPFA